MKHKNFRSQEMKKEKIIRFAIDILDSRIALSQKELDELKESMAAETKSSAGDKFETSREMMNQQKDKLLHHISELSKQKIILNSINVEDKKEQISLGAYAETSQGNFMISCSLGKVDVEGHIVMFISIASPLFQEMKNKVVDESFEFRNRKYEIRKIL